MLKSFNREQAKSIGQASGLTSSPGGILEYAYALNSAESSFPFEVLCGNTSLSLDSGSRPL